MDSNYLKKCLADGMSTRDIEKDCGVSKSNVSYWIKKYNLSSYSKFKKMERYSLDKIDTREKAYILGFILADSCISNNMNVEISVSLYDKCVVEFISKVIKSNVHYDHTLNRNKRRFPRARTCKRIKDITKFTGGTIKKDRHYPRVREDLEKFLIQGVFDADGCITWGVRKDKKRIWQKISFTSQLKILRGIQKYLINKLDISTVLRPKEHSDCYVLEFSDAKNVLKFCDHIYPNEEFIILNRKYLRYKALRLELEENGETNRSD